MPLRLDVKTKLSSRSDRVKCVDLHPTEPWMLVSLYVGKVNIWNHENQTQIKSFEVCDLPVRAAKFVPRKNWVVAGSDDMNIRVYNYNTLERVHAFDAHTDYIRSLAVHPSQPLLLSSSDDMLIKLWNWEKKWECVQVFEGHSHYVMQIVINPKDNNQFASASLDRHIKVWSLGSSTPNFTLEGHEKGVNCLDYYTGGDKPYLISGADDCTAKIWDYQTKTCVQTLEGHSQNVGCVAFHPELPIIITGSEDSTVRLWHINTYRYQKTLNHSMDRVWCCAVLKGSNNVAFGYDEGSIMVKFGREEPAMSMDNNGKFIWAKHSEIQQANLRSVNSSEYKDGERLQLSVKDLGSCEIYPQTLKHNSNGRFVVVCGDGEYIIYTAMALRNKSYGPALEFIWGTDSSEYAVRENNQTIKLYKNFKEQRAFKPDFGAHGIYAGNLLGVKTSQGLAFYSWDTLDLIRRIEITPKNVFWSDNGDLCCITTDESFFILKYDQNKVDEAKDNPELIDEDGISDAFDDDINEFEEVVQTGLWVGDCFIYTNSVNRLNYYVGGEIVTVAHLDRTLYILGYIPNENRLYLGDKELTVVSYELLLSVLEYQTAVMRSDFDNADLVLPRIPREQRTRVAHFLQKQGFKEQAMAVTADPEHKFELALNLGNLQIAKDLAQKSDSEQKWKQLADLATSKNDFELAQKCLSEARDFGGLMLLATSAGNKDMMKQLAVDAKADGKINVAFLSNFITGGKNECLELLIDAGRLPEAAFFARTYAPSQVSRVLSLWKTHLAATNKKASEGLADPNQYDNLFPGFNQSLLAEKFLEKTTISEPASKYSQVPRPENRDVFDEMSNWVDDDKETQQAVDTISDQESIETKESQDFEEPLDTEKSKTENEQLFADVAEDPQIIEQSDNVSKAEGEDVEEQETVENIIEAAADPIEVPEELPENLSDDQPGMTESSEEVVEESKEKVEEVVEAQTEEQEASTTESFEITSPIHQQSNQQNDDFQDLELDIENMNLDDDIDTSDVNLDEELADFSD